MTDINQTLAERGARYGRFRDHAFIAQGLKKSMWMHPGWSPLADDQKQALETIADKIARILNGDPNYLDNWHDIIGYAKLVEDRLSEQLPVHEPVEMQLPVDEHGPIEDAAWANLLVPGADEPVSQIVHQRGRIRQVIAEFMEKHAGGTQP